MVTESKATRTLGWLGYAGSADILVRLTANSETRAAFLMRSVFLKSEPSARLTRADKNVRAHREHQPALNLHPCALKPAPKLTSHQSLPGAGRSVSSASSNTKSTDGLLMLPWARS